MNERNTLAEAISRAVVSEHMSPTRALGLADALLASEWLGQHDEALYRKGFEAGSRSMFKTLRPQPSCADHGCGLNVREGKSIELFDEFKDDDDG